MQNILSVPTETWTRRWRWDKKKSLKSNLNNFWYFILILLPLIKQMILFLNSLNYSVFLVVFLMSINIHNNNNIKKKISRRKREMRNSSQGHKFQLTNRFNGTHLIYLVLNYILLYSITPHSQPIYTTSFIGFRKKGVLDERT